MSHDNQRKFCEYVRDKLPRYFFNIRVLDVGSLDINGNNRYLFEDCNYTGIDIVNGNNVDIVCRVHSAYVMGVFKDASFDVIISTEMLEHDKYWTDSLNAMVGLLKPLGLLLFTCATTDRGEHGTRINRPEDSPLTNDYYKNLTEEDIRSVLDIDNLFSEYEFQVNNETHDLYFWGIKK